MTSTASHSATPPSGRPAEGADGAEGPLPVGPSGPTGPRGPWSVRSARATRGRLALEVYEYGELADVLVATRLGLPLLRGARRCTLLGARESSALSWGRLPHGGAVPTVGFTGGRLRRPGRPGRIVAVPEVVTVAGEFWLAWAEGRFDGVLVRHAGGCERQALERVRPWRRLPLRSGSAL
ncbi:hypothetical protein [Kitasatospora sp. NPDC090091]|uniref:hypothetical protein n=1 Tax=Kitasatospora sp. NPDC090091 TaxID=3364081 RepID=UPI0038136464